VPILSVLALKLQNRQHNLLFGDCCLKKNVFENCQKVALNITVMDDISHEILQKLGNSLNYYVMRYVTLWHIKCFTLANYVSYLKKQIIHQDICAMYYVLPIAKP
jgi:hypothetical protein